jgi:prepilin-type N-terminal cleavage/methylation domain-containing protein
MFFLPPTQKINTNQGFGLIELMVSIGIITMVMGIVMTKHSSYNGAVLLRAQAYEIALQARETQLMAVSSAGQLGNYRNVYGLYFNIGTHGSYITFKDNNGNFYFDAGVDSIIGRHNLDGRFEIAAIRTASGGSVSNVNNLAIIFERPNFDARLYIGSNTPVLASVSSVYIDIRVKGTSGSGVGEMRTVEISKTGQIIVKPAAVANGDNNPDEI